MNDCDSSISDKPYSVEDLWFGDSCAWKELHDADKKSENQQQFYYKHQKIPFKIQGDVLQNESTYKYVKAPNHAFIRILLHSDDGNRSEDLDETQCEGLKFVRGKLHNVNLVQNVAPILQK